LFTFYNKHLMTGPEGNSEYLNVSRDEVEGNIMRNVVSCNSGHHFAGNSELFPV